MKKYDSYKNSGVEWIGEIPSHWNLNKVGNNTYVKGRIGWKGLRSEDFIDEGPFLITGTDFNKDGSINWEKTYHVDQERYDEDPFIQLQDHDVLITKDGTIGKIVYVGKLKGPTCLNSGIFLTRPIKEEYISKFFFWLLNSNIFKVFVDYNSGGSTIQHLYQNVFVNFKFPIPPLSEQKQIVSYLDEKTSLIDSLIEKTQRKIELLKEERTALINHTVTKGLNPNVEMKDSGVEWIGEIPRHWKLMKYKHHSDIVTGNTPSKVLEDIYYTEKGNGFPWIKPSNLDKGFGYVTESEEDLTEEGKTQTRLIPKDSIMICSIGNTLGKYGISGREVSTNQQINSVISNGITLSSRFCLFFTDVLTRDLINRTNFVTLPIFTKTDLENTEIIIPPLSEQEEIVQFLDEKTSAIDKTIELEVKRIALLKEYRQSLISEVVTGRIKVITDE